MLSAFWGVYVVLFLWTVQFTELQINQELNGILVFLPILVGLVSRQHPPHPLLLCSACLVQHILSL